MGTLKLKTQSHARLVLLLLAVIAFLAMAMVSPVSAAPSNEKGPRCSDGLDNDGDELFDADDPDCGGGDGGGDELPLTFVPVSGFWSGAVTEDNGSIDERWRWDTSNDDVDLDMPRPCGSGGLAVGGIRARFNCQKGGRIFVDLRGTSWVVSDNGNNRKMNEGFCELLNDWATFGDIEEYLVIFGPTFPDFAYDTIPNPDDGCPVEGPCGFSTNYASYFGQPRPHVEEVELHPFGHLPETDLPAVGRIQFRAFGESSDIVLSPNDLNPFMEPQTVAMTYFQIAFYAAHGGPVIGRCETEGLKAWFNTEPTED